MDADPHRFCVLPLSFYPCSSASICDFRRFVSQLRNHIQLSSNLNKRGVSSLKVIQ